MAETVADVVIGVSADIGPLMRETARAEAAMTRFGRVTSGISSNLARLGTSAGNLGRSMSMATAAMGAVAIGALAITRSAADAGEAIANGAKAAGLSTTAYQEYGYALSEAADMTGDEFAAATVKLNKQLGEARRGSETAIASFERLGLSAADIASGAVTGDQALAALVTTLENTTDPAIAAAIASDVLGKSGAKMGGMLSGTAGQVDDLRASARSLGIVMSEDAVKASDEFNESWDATVKQLEAVKIAIATALMPIIVDTLIPALQGTVIPAIVSVINTMGEWITAFSELPAPVQTAIGIVAGLFAVGGPLLIAVGATSMAISALVAATGPVGLLIVAAGLLTAAWVAWGDDFKAAIGGAIDWVSDKFTAFMAKIDAIVATLREWKKAAADFLSITPMTPEYSNPDALPGGSGDSGNSGGGGLFGSGGMGGMDGGAGNDQLGVAVADGLVNGMAARLEERRGEIAAIVDTIPQIARDQLGIQSPSTVFAEIGGYIGEGMAEGIAASAGAVAASIGTINGAAINSTQGMVSQTLGLLGNLFQGSKQIAMAQAAVNAWVGATEALKLPFPANVFAFGKVLATGLSAVQSIRGTNIGSSGTAAPPSAGGYTSGASGGASPQQTPAAIANLTINGMLSAGGFKTLTDQLNAEFKQGYVLNIVNA